MGFSLTAICGFVLLIINELTRRVLTYVSWHFPRSWQEVTQGHYSQEAIWKHSPSLKDEGKECFPCHFFSQGLPPPLSLLAWV